MVCWGFIETGARSKFFPKDTREGGSNLIGPSLFIYCGSSIIKMNDKI